MPVRFTRLFEPEYKNLIGFLIDKGDKNLGEIFTNSTHLKNVYHNDDTLIRSELDCKTIVNGYILLENAEYTDGYFWRGVYDSNNNFVTGMIPFFENQQDKIKNTTVKKFKKRKETVIFAGDYVEHFGTLLVGSFVRLWWVLLNPDVNYKIVFLSDNTNEVKMRNYLKHHAELLNIDVNRFEIIKEPTLFDKIIVPDSTSVYEKIVAPDSSTIYTNRLSPEYLRAFEKMVENVKAKYGESEHKKVYLSRTLFSRPERTNDGINEEFYENFYKKRGYYICHPETLSLYEQIKIISSADEIVTTYGSMAHSAALFGKKGMKLTLILRSEDVVIGFECQCSIMKLKDIESFVFLGTKNPYPTYHDGGVFLYYPTEHFKKYLESSNIPYEDSELLCKITDEQMNEYIVRWLTIYSVPKVFKTLNKPEFFPVLQALYYNVTGKRLNKDDFL